MPKPGTEFLAKHVVAKTDKRNGSYILGLADAAKNPSHYVLFQRPLEFDDEAAELGEDCHWFQYMNTSLSAYGACTGVRIFPDRLVISISRKTKKIHAATGGTITVEFKPTPALLAKLKKYLQLIL